jgi:hypothetical protein
MGEPAERRANAIRAWEVMMPGIERDDYMVHAQ